MKPLVLCSVGIALLLVAAPVKSAPFLRDHYTPGVTPSEALGWSVALNAKYIIAGRPGYDGSRGDVVVFDTVTGRTLRVLTPPADDRQPGDQFGWALAVRGEEAIIGAPGDTTGALSGSGSLYFFDLRTGRLRHKLVAPGSLERLGHSLAAEGRRVVSGAPETAYAGTSRGAVLVVDNAPGSPVFNVLELEGTPGEDNAMVGQSVAIYGDVVAAGAPYADNPGATDSGAVFLFHLNETPVASRRLTAPALAINARYGWAIGLTGDSLVSASNLGGSMFMQSYTGELKSTTTGLGTINSLAVSGRLIAVGKPGSGMVEVAQGYVSVYEARPGGGGGPLPLLYSVTPQLGLVGNEHFGACVALHGEILAGGAPGRFIDDAAGGGAIGSIVTARSLMLPLGHNLIETGVREVVTQDDMAPNRSGAFVRAPLELAAGASMSGGDNMTVLLGLSGASAKGGRGQLWTGEHDALRALRQSRDFNASSGLFASFSSPVANVLDVFAIAATLTGPGISAANNATYLGFDGSNITELFRKGAVNTHGRVVSFQPPRQANLSGAPRYGAMLRLAAAPGRAVTATDDTLFQVLAPNGAETFSVREGMASAFGPNLGQLGPWVSFEERYAVLPAALAGTPSGMGLVKLDASSGERTGVVRDVEPASSIPGAFFRTFPSAQVNGFSVGEVSFRATLRGDASVVNASNNEGLWRDLGGAKVLMLRKGSSPPGTVPLPAVKRILKHWVLTSSGAIRALVQFAGPGVTSANDLALIEVNGAASATRVLLREGDAAPGAGSARIGTLHRVDANHLHGFAVLLSLVSEPGVGSAGDNLALYARSVYTSYLYRTGLVLRKGMLMQRPGSAPVRLRSFAFSKQVNDPTGALASGLPHAVSPLPAAVRQRPISVGVIAIWSDGKQSALSVHMP